MSRTLVLTPSVAFPPEDRVDSQVLVVSALAGFLDDPINLSAVNRGQFQIEGKGPDRARLHRSPELLNMRGEMDRFIRWSHCLNPERRISGTLSLKDRDQILTEYRRMNLSAPYIWGSWRQPFENAMDLHDVRSIAIALPKGSPSPMFESFSPRLKIQTLEN